MRNEKNPMAAAALGFFFGGFGLFYISIGQGFAALAVLITLSVCSGGYGLPFVWLGCAFWGYFAAVHHNDVQHTYDDVEIDHLHDRFPPIVPKTGQAKPVWRSADVEAEPVKKGNYCGECGSSLRANIKFCTDCGAPT
ncbi:MAG: hypothetical protein ACNA8W_25110 [Bradymonadaceae bacterium]